MAKSGKTDLFPRSDAAVIDPEFEARFWADDGVKEYKAQWDVTFASARALGSAFAEKVFELGGILDAVKTRHDRQGFLAFCKGNGITQQRGYEFIQIFENRHNPLVKKLDTSKAIRLLPILTDTGTTVTEDAVILQDGTEVPISEIENMSHRQIQGLVKELRTLKKRHEKVLADTNELHKREMDHAREENQKLKRKVAAAGAMTFSGLMGRARGHMREAGVLVDAILEMDLTYPEKRRLRELYDRLHDERSRLINRLLEKPDAEPKPGEDTTLEHEIDAEELLKFGDGGAHGEDAMQGGH